MLRRRLLAVLVALTVVLTLAAPAAFAVETPEEETNSIQQEAAAEETAGIQPSATASDEETGSEDNVQENEGEFATSESIDQESEELPERLSDTEKKSFTIQSSTYVNGEAFGLPKTRKFENVDNGIRFNINSDVFFDGVTECESVTLNGTSIDFTSDNVASVLLNTSQFNNGDTAFLKFHYVYTDSGMLYSFKEKQVFQVGESVIAEFITQDIKLCAGEQWTVKAYGWGPFKKDGLPEKYSKTYWWLGMTETRGGEDGVIGRYPSYIPAIGGSATMIHGETEHIFYYYPYHTATIKYQDENGLTLAKQKTIAGYFEAQVDIEKYKLAIDDYNFKEVKGELITSVENTEIILVYEPIKYNVTVHYVDKNGNKLHESFAEKYVPGSTFSIDSPVIEGFIPDVRTIVSDEGGMPKEDLEYTVTYSRTALPVGSADPPEITPDDTATILNGAAARGYELIVIGEEKTPLAGGFLDAKCCILHLLIMLLAAAVLIWYTMDMKKQQKRIFELEEQLDLH